MGRKRAKNQVRDTDSIVGRYVIDTGHAEIKPDAFRDNGFYLYVNGVPSSHVVIGEPEYLDFAYMRWFAAAIEDFLGRHGWDTNRLRVTHLGGAGCSMARYLAWRWPQSRHTVVELDTRLGEYVRDWFDIPRSPTVKIRPGDAAEVTASFTAESRNIVIRDVFSGDSTPSALTTTEFAQQVYQALTPGGLYLANCGARSGVHDARAEIARLQEIFAEVAVISDAGTLQGRSGGNMVLVATDAQLPQAGSPAADQLRSVLLRGAVPAQYLDADQTQNWSRE